MNNPIRIFLVILFFLPTLACGTVSTVSTNHVRGSGKIVTQTIDVNNFDSVSLEGSGNVYIVQGDSESVTVETDDNILPLLETKVNGHELVLGMKPNQSIDPSKPIVYQLTVKDLNGIDLKGSGNFYVSPVQSNNMAISLLGSGDIRIKGLATDSLAIDLSGSGNITIEEIAVKTVDTNLKGSGDIKLDGKSEAQTVSVAGSGNYLAADLETGSANISIPGSADVTVWVNDTLQVTVNGSGSVSYYGSPDIDQNGSGSGHLKSLGDK
jgi:hypothetical protein